MEVYTGNLPLMSAHPCTYLLTADIECTLHTYPPDNTTHLCYNHMGISPIIDHAMFKDDSGCADKK